MLVLSRYRVLPGEREGFLEEAGAALRVLSGRPGCRAARLARALDDPELWVLHSEWDSVGAYRRALSSYDVKVHAVPLMYRCIDEPSAFEVRLDARSGAVEEVAGALADDAWTGER